MGKQREFYDKPLFSLLNHISWLLLGGIYFILLNIPLIFFFTVTSIDINQFSIVLLFICLIPFGLALGALYSTMGEIIREKDISFSSYFFRASRRIPKNEFAPRRTSGEHVVVRRFGDVRPVGHFTHVAHEKRSGERCLSDVRVADEAQMNAKRIGCAHGCPLD